MPRKNRRKVGEGVDYVTCRLCGRAFRVVNWPHLVTVHGLDPDDFLAEYERRFPGASHISRATKIQMKEGQNAWNERTGRRWTKARILRLIRQERRKLGRTPTVKDVPQSHRYAAQRHFGGWLAALQAAGVPHRYGGKGRYWTRERILLEIRKRARTGQSIRFGAAAREGKGLTVGAKREFEGWSAAVRAAGYSHLLPTPHRRWTKAELFALLKGLVKKHGYVSSSLLRQARLPGYVRPDWALGRLFGSLERALREAGIPRRRRPAGAAKSLLTRPAWTKWSPESVLHALRVRFRRGLPMNAAAVQKRHGSLYHAAVKRFGSWPETLRRLGLQPDDIQSHRVWSREKVLGAIRELGGPVGHAEIHRRDSSLLATARRIFGTWRAACQAAGMPLPPRGYHQVKWTRERILLEIRRRGRRGVPLTSTPLARGGGMGGFLSAASREFGGWRQAVRAAGFAT